MTTCKDCKFWAGDDKALREVQGPCRRFPPSTILVPGPQGEPVLQGRFPETKGNSWCGEHKPKLVLTN